MKILFLEGKNGVISDVSLAILHGGVFFHSIDPWKRPTGIWLRFFSRSIQLIKNLIHLLLYRKHIFMVVVIRIRV